MVPIRPEPQLVGSFSTLPDAMDAAAEQFGDRDAFVDGDQHLSFVQWRDRADALEAELVERGVRPVIASRWCCPRASIIRLPAVRQLERGQSLRA